MSAIVQQQIEPEAVLVKALLNASKQLGLNQTQLASVLGIDRTAISRFKKDPQLLQADSKKGELALLLIRIARSLFMLTGGDTEWMKHFMHSPNKVTGGIPAQQIASIQGLIKVVQFTDSIRGKI